MKRIEVVSGISFPFYPPRPVTGVPLNARTSVDYVKRESTGFYLQPKLNGDRVIVLIKDGQVLAINRHGSTYSFKIQNTPKLLKFECDTLIDGEVWKKDFYPFEVVVSGGINLSRECPSLRGGLAKTLSLKHGIGWIFDSPTQQYVDKGRANLPVWEGVVKKKLGSPYIPLASDAQHTTTWFKNKW